MSDFRYLLFASALLTFICASAQRPALDDEASVGVYVYDLRNNKVIADYQSQLALSPASITKALTVASSLLTVGPEFRFETPVRLIGVRDNNGAFNGELQIKASGDPTINSEHFPQAGGMIDSIVAAVEHLGISRINGPIVVDQSGWTVTGPRGRWTVNDLAWDYGAPFFAFNFGDNTINVNVRELTAPAHSGLQLVRGNTAGEFDMMRGFNSNELVIDGVIPKQTTLRSTTLPDPAAYFTGVLTDRLAARGITVDPSRRSRQANADTIEIYRHISPRSLDICRSLMHRSDNMMADAMLRTLSPVKTLSAALKAEENLWKSRGVDLGRHRILDGSGLIRVDAISPRAMGAMLISMAANSDYVSTFPRCGRDGTVKRFLAKTRLEGKVALKSGSMTGVRCYAGYALDSDNRPTHVIVLMVNNSFLPGADQRTALENYLRKLLP